jgi:hypothetical protein
MARLNSDPGEPLNDCYEPFNDHLHTIDSARFYGYCSSRTGCWH